MTPASSIRYIYRIKRFRVLSIAEYFYELCRILTSRQGESKYKQRVKIHSDTTHPKTSGKLFIIQLFFFFFVFFSAIKSFCAFLVRREKQSG